MTLWEVEGECDAEYERKGEYSECFMVQRKGHGGEKRASRSNRLARNAVAPWVGRRTGCGGR